MSLRELMPDTAWLVDELRRQWGRERTDALVRLSMHGQGSVAAGRMYAVETGPDGVERTFGQPLGRAQAGRAAVTLRGMGGAQVDAHCSIELDGSSRRPPTAGNSDLDCSPDVGGALG